MQQVQKQRKPQPERKPVKTTVLTPQNSEELEIMPLLQKKQEEPVKGPVHINEELPVYLL